MAKLPGLLSQRRFPTKPHMVAIVLLTGSEAHVQTMNFSSSN